MSFRALALSLHVVAAILLGQIVATAVLASSMRREPGPSPIAHATLRRLVRGTSIALAFVVASGVLLEAVSGAVFHESVWFRLSFLQVLVIGALNGWTSRVLRRANGEATINALRGIVRRAWAMSLLIADIVVLMELKPG